MPSVIFLFTANIWKILQNNWGDGGGRLTDSMQILHGLPRQHQNAFLPSVAKSATKEKVI